MLRMRDEICGVGALAVANSYGFLLKRLTLSLVGCPIVPALREVVSAEVGSQNLIYGKFPQMQEESSR